jgi:hypothetical protein
MTEVLAKIRNRYYAVNIDNGTFHRAQPDARVGEFPDLSAEIATDILGCRYWRKDLTEEQNATANDLAQESYTGDDVDDINVVITSLRIMKERAFLQAVVVGDEQEIEAIEADERGATMFSKKLGGTNIGSTVVLSTPS